MASGRFWWRTGLVCRVCQVASLLLIDVHPRPFELGLFSLYLLNRFRTTDSSSVWPGIARAPTAKATAVVVATEDASDLPRKPNGRTMPIWIKRACCSNPSRTSMAVSCRGATSLSWRETPPSNRQEELFWAFAEDASTTRTVPTVSFWDQVICRSNTVLVCPLICKETAFRWTIQLWDQRPYVFLFRQKVPSLLPFVHIHY